MDLNSFKNFRVLNLDRIQFLAFLKSRASYFLKFPNQPSEVVANLNAHALDLLETNPEFNNAFRDFKWIFFDGFGASLAAWAESGQWIQRLTYADFIQDWLKMMEDLQLTLFVAGYTSHQLSLISDSLKEDYPQLRLVGSHHGFFSNENESDSCMAQIASLQPHVLLVGMGMPKQEFFCRHIYSSLNSCLIFPVGAALLYATEMERRGPAWMTQNGLEWLYRLIREPRRLWKRTLLSNVYLARTFIALLFKRLKRFFAK